MNKGALKKFVMPALLAAGLLWLMFGADREKPAQLQTLAMGTLVDMTVLGLGGQTNHQVLQEAMRQLRDLETQWHPDQRKADASGLLAEINSRLGNGELISVPPPLMAGFTQAAEYSRSSSGLFDPAVGGLVKLWGFHSEASFPEQAPTQQAIANALPGKRFDELLRHKLLKGFGGLRLDFGAFAKGLILQQVADNIRAQYPKASFLLNGGGDLVAAGQRPERPWRIAVRHPRVQNKYLALIELKDGEAAFTSGDYERFFDAADAQGNTQHYHHILDPRNGWPSTGTQSLTVLHADAGLADAASTALFVAGDNWPTIAAQMGVQAVLRVTANGAIEWTPAMASRVELTALENGELPKAHVRTLP